MEFENFTNTSEFDNGFNLAPKPNNFLALSIVATVLGFCSYMCIGLILGIIAIVMSTQSTSKYNRGDLQGAISSANTAKYLALAALVAVLVQIIVAYVQIQSLGGWDAYVQSIKDMIEAAQ